MSTITREFTKEQLQQIIETDHVQCGEASALAQVAKCELPMLFIHGDADDYVPTWMVYPLYEAKPGEKELWLVPGAGHAYSYRDNREEYTAVVREFVGKYVR